MPTTSQRKRSRARLRRIKHRVFEHYGFKCSCPLCPFHSVELSMDFLTLDHINNDGGQEAHRLGIVDGHGAGGAGGPYYAYVHKQILDGQAPTNIQSMCAMCNMGKFCNKGICPHMEGIEQPTTTYVKGGAKQKKPLTEPEPSLPVHLLYD